MEYKLDVTTPIVVEVTDNITENDPFLPEEQRQLMLACQIYGFIVGILGIIGIPANLVSLLVFYKNRDKTSTNFLLQVLAIADSFFLFWSMFIWTGFAFNVTSSEGIIYYFDTFSYALPLIKGISEFSRDFAVWMVVLVSFDRFTAIYYPLLSSTMSRVPKVKIATFVILVCALAINIPRFTHIKFDGTRSMRTSDFAYGVVYFAVDALIIHLMPMILVVFMNSMIIKALKEASRRRVVATRCDNERESCTTLTLVAISTIFVICELPKAVQVALEVYIYIHYDDKDRIFGSRSALIILIYTLIANTFQIVNSFVNFWIYCLIAKRFRVALRKILDNAKNNARSMVFGSPKSSTETYGL